MKYLKIFEEFKINSNEIKVIKDKIEVYHYSNNMIENGKINVGTGQNIWSNREYKVWGRGRAFFYTNVDQVSSDKGVPSKEYLYVCHIPLKNVYDMGSNPKKYTGTFEDKYKKSKVDGYTAWMYNLSFGAIIISFQPVKISKSYKHVGKGWVDINADISDYIIGSIKLDNDWHQGTYNVYVKGDMSLSLSNCYALPKGIKPDDAASWDIVKIEIPDYKNIKLSSKFKGTELENDIKKYL